MLKRTWRCRLLLCLLHGAAFAAMAGPPFQTDDPEPVPFQHYEAYLFSQADSTGTGTGAFGPAAEFNWGALPNLQLHVIVPLASAFLPTGQRFFGMSDIEIGAKYRFVQEAGNRPQVGVFPLVELPSGDVNRELGNGQVWARLPLWIQKSWGPWTTYGGAGEGVNSAPGTRNFPFTGWLVQRDLSKKLTLGVEAVRARRRGPRHVQSTCIYAAGRWRLLQHEPRFQRAVCRGAQRCRSG